VFVRVHDNGAQNEKRITATVRLEVIDCAIPTEERRKKKKKKKKKKKN
jgi:hypothetical protein